MEEQEEEQEEDQPFPPLSSSSSPPPPPISPFLPLSDQLSTPNSLLQNLPQIIKTLITELSTSKSAIPHCSREISHLSRYAIDVTDPELQTDEILKVITNPFFDSLLVRKSVNPILSEGCAFCLIPLVQSEVWRQAQDGLVNQLFQRVAAVLEDDKEREIGHVELAGELVRANGFVAEAYGRLLLNCAGSILGDEMAERELRFCAMEMVDCLVEARILSSEEKIGVLGEDWSGVEEGKGGITRGSDVSKWSVYDDQRSCGNGDEVGFVKGEDSDADPPQKRGGVVNGEMGLGDGVQVKGRREWNGMVRLLILVVCVTVALLAFGVHYECGGSLDFLPPT